METKICNNCESEKNISEYFKDLSLKSGYRGICKSCVKSKNYKHNLQKTIDNDRTCAKCNILKSMDEFYSDKHGNQGKFTTCKKCCMKRKNERNKIRRKNDPKFQILSHLRNRFREMVNSENKKISSIKLLSCELDFFKKWIEFQFDETMTWENHGEWHFDHVKPCSSFDLTKIEEQQICFCWKNFRPLAKTENLKKKNRIVHSVIQEHELLIEKFLSLQQTNNI
jgi:hypothetical protein